MDAAKQRFEALVASRKRSKGHSGRQMQVLGLYKRFLRLARVKDRGAYGDLAKAVRQSFRERRSIPMCVVNLLPQCLPLGSTDSQSFRVCTGQCGSEKVFRCCLGLILLRTDFETIEYYLAQGERQLARLQSASVSSMTFVSVKREPATERKTETETDGAKE